MRPLGRGAPFFISSLALFPPINSEVDFYEQASFGQIGRPLLELVPRLHSFRRLL